MLRLLRPLSPLALGALLALAGCGGSTDTTADAATGSLPYGAGGSADGVEQTTPTLGSAVVPRSGDGSQSATDATAELEVSAELLTSMLSTEQGRLLVVQSLAEQSGLSPQDASCFLDNVSAETMVALAELGGADPATTLPGEALVELDTGLTACGIAPGELLP
jgi:hypothetical protein